jgi:hypothetical protein
MKQIHFPNRSRQIGTGGKSCRPDKTAALTRPLASLPIQNRPTPRYIREQFKDKQKSSQILRWPRVHSHPLNGHRDPLD